MATRAQDKQITKLENKIRYWANYLEERQAHFAKYRAEKLAKAVTDGQRSHVNGWCDQQEAQLDVLRATKLAPLEEELRQLMFKGDGPEDGLDA